MQNNAHLIYNYFTGKGWTLNAIAGMLGNMQRESTINPGVWQNLDTSYVSGGYGLVQWTPSTNVTTWLTSNGYNMNDANSNGNGQCARIIYELENGLQWIPTSGYPMTFSEYSKSTLDPRMLATIFLKHYERAGVEALVERQDNAEYWYGYLRTVDPDIPIPVTRKKKKRYKFVLFNRRRFV